MSTDSVWRRLYTDEGRAYFVEEGSGQTVWELPEGVDAGAVESFEEEEEEDDDDDDESFEEEKDEDESFEEEESVEEGSGQEQVDGDDEQVESTHTSRMERSTSKAKT